MSKIQQVIYFLQREDGAVKIGTTVNLPQRMISLRNKHGELNCLGVINGSANKEKILHWCLSGDCISGEWFNLTPDIQGVIDEFATVPALPKRKKKYSPPPINKVRACDLVMAIFDIEDVLGWSYPTALKYAQEHGVQNESGKWLVPLEPIKLLVQANVSQALRMQARLFAFEDALRVI